MGSDINYSMAGGAFYLKDLENIKTIGIKLNDELTRGARYPQKSATVL